MMARLLLPLFILLRRNAIWMLLLVALHAPPVCAANEIHVGILAERTQSEVAAQWAPLAGIIPGYKVTVEALPLDELEAAVSQRRVDFVLTNARHYVLLARRSGLSSPLATLVTQDSGVPLADYGGVIFVRSHNTSIKTLKDVAGKTVATRSADSFGGYLAQAYELRQVGVRLPDDVRLINITDARDSVVKAVLDGRAEVGLVPSGEIEAMARNGKLDPAQIHVINAQKLQGYPHQVSTRLYPNWPLAALPHTSHEVQRSVVVSLLDVARRGRLSAMLGIHGFDLPANYSGIEEVMRELRVAPFDAAPAITSTDIWQRFRSEIIAGMLSLVVLIGLGLTLLNINRRLRSEKAHGQEQARQLHASHQLLDQIIDNVPSMIFLKNADDLRFKMMNRAGEVLIGVDRKQLIGRNDHDFFPPEQADFFISKDREVLAQSKVIDIPEEEIQTSQGPRLLHTKKITLRDEAGQPAYLLGISEDITEKRRAEREIESLAFYDPLTELPNRRLYSDRLKQAMAISNRSGQDVALLLIDLDNFKTLNDTKGHDYGDLLLQQVAQRLTACTREGDTVARMGGDEFLIILKDLTSNSLDAAAQARMVGEKIIRMLADPFSLRDHVNRCSASIGITLLGQRDISLDDLQREADIAMYQAKKSGRNTLRFFDPAMHNAVATRADMERDLHHAIYERQFVLHYQAQLASDGTVLGAEILLRWQHPTRGMVSPAQFIPLAEESGLILPIGHWVLESACRQLAAWAQSPATEHLVLAVNVSARQFSLPQFVHEVLNLIDGTGAPPSRLKLELTESMLVEHHDEIIAKMNELKQRGIQFSLDDFGTGYSSLTYLKRMPLDQLKIDRSFVSDVTTNPQDAAIARTIVALGESLGLAVIAEGVETEEQRDFLFEAGCLTYQGYLFSRPIPVDEFEQFLQCSKLA